jgi:hypothetical protein
VDDRFDTSMREKIGADTSKTLPLLLQHDFTFLIEDPATIWNLWPAALSADCRTLSGRSRRALKNWPSISTLSNAIRTSIPPKQQTGSELFALLHLASAAFPRVAVYFENSILAPDLQLLPIRSAGGRSAQTGRRETRRHLSRGHRGALVWSGISRRPSLADCIRYGRLASSWIAFRPVVRC